MTPTKYNVKIQAMLRLSTVLSILILSLISLTLTSVVHAASPLTSTVTVDPSHLSGHTITLTYGKRSWTASAAEVSHWYKTTSQNEQTTLQLRPGAIYNYLNVNISPKVNQLGQTSRFIKIDGNLHLIGPGWKGKIVDGERTSLAIRSALVSGKTVVPIFMKVYRPAVFSAADFNKLTFPDHLARGESNFVGSPANRKHNIAVATARYNGLVIMPGEQFSFNQNLGTVDAANGYLPELVIKDNVTTPEYGGGICQVSTTTFRAAMQAGLKINARQNHSYPVSYYGTPGYDATVYQPAPDLKFTNDTQHPVYLTTSIIGTRLIFDVWGTNEGRQTTINGPFVTARYPDGSLTAAVAQLVKQNGKSIREQNFVSKYQSADEFPTIRSANGE